MKLLTLFSLLPLAISSHLEERADASILKSTYPKISFGHSRADISSYTKESIQSLLKSVNNENGQFLGGDPNLLGQFFFWPSVNGWTAVAQYDLQLKGRGPIPKSLIIRNYWRRILVMGLSSGEWSFVMISTMIVGGLG
jgi:hypothetical protein